MSKVNDAAKRRIAELKKASADANLKLVDAVIQYRLAQQDQEADDAVQADQ